MKSVVKATYTFEEVRKHNSSKSAWTAIHGKVYDITQFLERHPGGQIIATSLGRDGTVLFETHHNLIDDKKSIFAMMAKMEIGVIKDYKEVAKFDSPFAIMMLSRVKTQLKGKSHRESLTVYLSVIAFYTIFLFLIACSFLKFNLWLTPMIGVMMSLGHLCGHAGNHASLSSRDWVNKFVSITCTNLWGLREKYWEFSHLISHHCYNYTDRDYILEQHVPTQFFRVRDGDPWRPIHAYQHLILLTTPFTAFFVGAIRLDCAPWIFVFPLLSFLKRNKDSPLPAPQFFASGSNVDVSTLKKDDDGVGPENFVVFNSFLDDITSIVIANVIWLPLFLHNWRTHGFINAVLYNSLCFGVQSAFTVSQLLNQHCCEGIKLDTGYSSSDDWYAKQVQASTTIAMSGVMFFMAFGIQYQTEHHMFPSMSPSLYPEVARIVKETAKEFDVQYNYLTSSGAASLSVYKQFKILGKKPALKTL